MNRLIAATVAILAAATGTSVATAVVPALAAPHSAVNHAAVAFRGFDHPHPARAAKAAARTAYHGADATAAKLLPVEIASKLAGGKYVTVVHCSGTVSAAPSVHLGKPDAPLTVVGTGSSPQLLKTLTKPNSYKTVYTCTVTVDVKVAAKKAHPAKKADRPGTTCEIAASASGGHQGGHRGGHRGGHQRAACTKAVTLNTGFGGQASRVVGHHPAG